MKIECKFLKRCGFIQKYGESREFACEGFILIYCRGPKVNECRRKEYRLNNGYPPPDEMMPSGLMIRE